VLSELYFCSIEYYTIIVYIIEVDEMKTTHINFKNLSTQESSLVEVTAFYLFWPVCSRVSVSLSIIEIL
jgi:hypothetical protein